LKENSIWLADQLELLLNTCLTTPSINPRSVVAHLNGMSPLPGESFYEGIHSLEPGHYLEINRTTLELRRYWQVEPGQELKLASDKEYASAFRELFFDIVPEHLPGSPTGVTLSSGLDSTSIAAAVKSTVPSQQLTAFCWVTPELPSADESRYIHDVCQKLNLPAIELRADLCWPLSTQEGIRTSRATPFYNYYTELWDEVFRTVQQNEINTLFTGASGDNLFGGNVFAYPDLLLTGHWLELARQIRTHIPRSPNRLNLAQIVRKLILAPIVRTYRPRWTYRRPRPVPWLGENYQDLYQAHFPTLTSTPLLLPGRRQRLEMLRDPRLTRITEWTTKQAASYHIDLRHPLLDHRLMEFAARLPTTQTFRAAQRKIIVRNAMRGYLPDSVLNMWDKIYPTEIFVRGVRERETGKVWSLLTDMRAAQLGFVNPEILRRNYQDYLDGKHQNDRFWHALTLEDWLRRYF
jgi:asparagine synthase (glutamine-hydrolysing)